MYWESRGSGGTPLIVAHGGFGTTAMLGAVAAELARDRQVVSIELQGHGHTRDIDRPFRYESFGDDIAALIEHLGLGRVDLFGYSLGGGSSLRTTIQHPGLVRRLALLSTPCRRDGWFPEVRAGMDMLGSSAFEQLRHSPMYEEYSAVAPDVDAFPALMDRTGELLRTPYDWTADVKGISAPTLLIYADADSISTAHTVEFFSLLGGGVQDGNFDGTPRTPMRLAILPNQTHYTVFLVPQLASIIAAFLAESGD
jgi:pimeloyl-ACP methyl ester carboxylesterase